MPTATYIHLPQVPFFSRQTTLPERNADDVFVWRIPVFPGREFALGLVPLLTRAEVDTSLRFAREDDRQRFLVGRGVLRLLLAQFLNQSPESILIGAGAHNKPILTGDHINAIHFNVSHSGEWILIGFASSPLGVDIEQINPDFDFEEVRQQYFTPEEMPFTQDAAGFYESWSRKESLIKAFGTGLNDQLLSFSSTSGEHDLKSVAPDAEEDWTIVSFLMNEQYAVAIANHAGAVLHFIDFEPPIS